MSSIAQNNFVALFRFSDITLKLFEHGPRIFSFLIVNLLNKRRELFIMFMGS